MKNTKYGVMLDGVLRDTLSAFLELYWDYLDELKNGDTEDHYDYDEQKDDYVKSEKKQIVTENLEVTPNRDHLSISSIEMVSEENLRQFLYQDAAYTIFSSACESSEKAVKYFNGISHFLTDSYVELSCFELHRSKISTLHWLSMKMFDGNNICFYSNLDEYMAQNDILVTNNWWVVYNIQTNKKYKNKKLIYIGNISDMEYLGVLNEDGTNFVKPCEVYQTIKEWHDSLMPAETSEETPTNEQ